MVTVKGEGGGCVSGVVLEVAKWTLAGRMAGEQAMRSVVTKPLFFPSCLPHILSCCHPEVSGKP